MFQINPFKNNLFFVIPLQLCLRVYSNSLEAIVSIGMNRKVSLKWWQARFELMIYWADNDVYYPLPQCLFHVITIKLNASGLAWSFIEAEKVCGSG